MTQGLQQRLPLVVSASKHNPVQATKVSSTHHDGRGYNLIRGLFPETLPRKIMRIPSKSLGTSVCYLERIARSAPRANSDSQFELTIVLPPKPSLCPLSGFHLDHAQQW